MAKKPYLTVARKTDKRKIGGVRKAILDRLTEMGKTRNWLAVECGLRVATVYEFLAGHQNVRTDKLEQMMDALGLKVCSAPDATPDTTRTPRKSPKSR